MIINMTLTNPGTRLSCAAEVAAASRPGTGLFAGTASVSAHEIRGMRRDSRRWATGVVVFGTQGVLAAYPQACGERRTTGLAAPVAVTKFERTCGARDLEFHAATQTASTNHVNHLWRRAPMPVLPAFLRAQPL